MAEELVTPEGESLHAAPVDVSDSGTSFARMMDHASGVADDTPDVPAPPRRSASADKEVAQETEKRVAKRGRPPKSARTTTSAPPSKKDDKKLEPKDFTGSLHAIGDTIWISASQLPVAAPYAALLHGAQPALVSALNQGAQSNVTLRKYLDSAEEGSSNMWMVSLAAIAVQVGMQGMALARDAELRKQVTEANKAQVHAYLMANNLIPDAPATEAPQAAA